jgi:hypothetical protein
MIIIPCEKEGVHLDSDCRYFSQVSLAPSEKAALDGHILTCLLRPPIPPVTIFFSFPSLFLLLFLCVLLSLLPSVTDGPVNLKTRVNSPQKLQEEKMRIL